MKPVRFEPEALDELDAAYLYYETLAVGLGDALRAEVEAKLRVMSEFPLAYPQWEGAARRAVLQRFPYTVFFRVYDEEIRIVAVLYARLDPEQMLRRIFG